MDLPPPSPAYVELRRDIVINADLWAGTAQILTADFGFEGIIGIPDLNSAADLARAVAAGAGVNGDFARLTPTPPLRNLTSAQSVLGLIAGGFGGTVVRGDALPIVFSWPVLPSSVSPTDIAIRLNNGQVVTPATAALIPNFDYNERNVIVVFGEFGNRLTPGMPGAIYPVSVEIVSDGTPLHLIGPNGLQSAVGLTAASRNPYVAGPTIVAAKLSRFSVVGDAGPLTVTGGLFNDGATLYQSQATYRLRVMTNGGFSPDGVTGLLPSDFSRLFQLQAKDANGQVVTINRDGTRYDLGPGLGSLTVLGLADLGPPGAGIPAPYYRGDNDNFIDIILTGDEAAVRSLYNIVLPTAATPGYMDIYTPGGPGRTPTPGTTYTARSVAQSLSIDTNLDDLRTVSYAAQQVGSYDRADELPVVFRLLHPDNVDTIYTASSNRAASLIQAGYVEQGVPFANEGAGRPRLAVQEFHAASLSDHLYTADPAEIARLRQAGSLYVDQGVAFTAFAQPVTGAGPVHRFFAPTLNHHFFTPSLSEGFAANGYAYEGIGWYSAILTPADHGDVRFNRSDMLDFTGSLTGSPQLTKQGTGTLTLSGNSSVTGATSVEAGTLNVTGSLRSGSVMVANSGTLSGSGIIIGAVTNAGTLSPGASPGILTVQGSVANSAGSQVRVELNGAAPGNGEGFHDQIRVTGASGQFVAAGMLNPVTRGFVEATASPFTPSIGQGFTIVTAAGGISGSFAGLSQPTSGLPSGGRFDLIYRPDSLRLVVTPVSYATMTGLTGNQGNIAAAIQALRPVAGNRPGEDRADLFDALYQTDPDTLPAAFDQLGGAIQADMATALLDTGRLFGSMLAQRATAMRDASLAADMTPMAGIAQTGNGSSRSVAGAGGDGGGVTRIWARAVAGFGDHASRNGVAGFETSTGGFTSGIDMTAAPSLDLGVSFGYFRTDVTGDADGDGGDIDLFALAGYGSFTKGGYFADGSVAVIMGEDDSHRSIRFSTIDRRARGGAETSGISSSLAFGYRWLDDDVVIEPSLSLRQGSVRRGGFVETGADDLGLTLTRAGADSLRSGVGLRAAWGYRQGALQVEPEVRLRWEHEFQDRAGFANASLLDAPMTLHSAQTGRDAAILGTGLVARLDERLDGFAGYDLERRRGASLQMVTAGVRYRLQ